MKKTAIILILITLLSKSLGFVREMVLAYFYGTSSISDAYLISMTIPIVIFSLIGVGITTGYIPMYSNIEKSEGEAQGNLFTNNLINTIIIISIVIIIIGLLFTNQLIRIFSSGFEGETLKMAVSFTRISLFGLCFTTLVEIFSGFLQLKDNYIAPAFVGVILNISIIVAILIGSRTDSIVLPIGSVLSIASQLIFLIYFIRQKGFRYRLILNLKDKYIISMARMTFPLIIGISVNQVNVLIDRTIASRIAIGGISALYYADRLNSFVLSTIVMSISISIYPLMSKKAANNNIIELKKIISESIGAINLLIIPATIGTMIFAVPATNLVFGRGAFNSNALNMTSKALFFFSLGMLGVGLREILTRVFYSLQDTKTPMLNGILALVLNIVLDLFLARIMGIAGLALATSIVATLSTGVLFIGLRKKIGPFGMKQISISFIKILFASLLMGTIAKVSFIYLTTIISQNLSLIVSIFIGVIIYFTIIYFMKIENVDGIINAIKRKIKRSVSS